MDNPSSESLTRPLTLTEATDLRYLEPTKLRLFMHGAALRLTIEDEMSCLAVAIVRLFPLSQANQYLSVRSADQKEIGILREAKALDDHSHSLIEAELERRYLVPVVQRIISVKERFGTIDWQVETDRGPRSFTTRNLRENITQPTPERYLFNDVDGNRYDVRDLSALDPASRSHVLRYI
jgi:hypothetical protein